MHVINHPAQQIPFFPQVNLSAGIFTVTEMGHQWLEGNLPVSSHCTVCDKKCGSVRRLVDARCLWCKATVSVMMCHYVKYKPAL